MSEIIKDDLKKIGFTLVDKGDWCELFIKNNKKDTLVATLSNIDKEDYFKIIPTTKLHIIGPPPFRMLKIINSENLESTVLNKIFMAAFMLANYYIRKIILIDAQHRNSLLGIFYTNNHDYNYH